MILLEQLVERQQQWERFAQWKANQPLVKRPAADILADLGALWNWLHAQRRGRDPDPEKRGIQRMRRALALLGDPR